MSYQDFINAASALQDALMAQTNAQSCLDALMLQQNTLNAKLSVAQDALQAATDSVKSARQDARKTNLGS